MAKLSSGAKRLKAELDAARTGTFDALEISLRANLRDLTEVNESRMVRERPRLLIELANMRDDGLSIFRRNFSYFQPETDLFLLNVRDSLRQVWLGSARTSGKQKLVDALMAASFARPHAGPHSAGIRALLPVGHLVVSPLNFRAQLAIAILEHWQRFAVCNNPECPARYFLRKRKDQKYCERGECTRHGLRRSAKKWWNAHGPEWRAKHQRAKKKSRRRTKR